MRKFITVMVLMALLLICGCKSIVIDSETINKIYSYIPYPEAYSMRDITNIYEMESLPSRFIAEFEDLFNVNVEASPVAFSDADYFGGNWPLIPKTEIVQLWEKMYGVGTFEKYHFNFVEDIGDYSSKGILIYDENSDSYVYAQNFNSEGIGIDCQSYRKMISYEIKGDFLFIYDIYGSFYSESEYDDDLQITENVYIISGECVFVHGTDYEHYVIDKINSTDDTVDSVVDKLYSGEYDGQLPTYKHTFAKAQDGSFYWVQSEVMDVIKPIKTEDLFN